MLIYRRNIYYVLHIISHISHPPKTKCSKCKIKRSTKCNECNITASYNFPELKPLKCLKHRETGMANIKRKHVLCEKHDISHSKKSGCKICKLDIDNYYESSKYMQDKIFENFHYNLTEKIKKKFKNHNHKEMHDNILINSKNKNIIKFKRIYEERQRISYIMGFYIGNKYQYYGINKNKINDLNNKIKKLNTLKRKIFKEFDKSNYKNINEYIEHDKDDDNVLNYIIIKRKSDLLKQNIDKIVKNVAKEKREKKSTERDEDEDEGEDEIKKSIEESRSEYELYQERMKTYNKEILRHNRNPKEPVYIQSLFKLEKDLSLQPEEHYNVMKGHFKSKSHLDNFNEKIKIKINKSIEDKFVDIIFDFNKLNNNHIYCDLHFKEIIKEKIKENQKKNKKYKYTILKIFKYRSYVTNSKDIVNTIKINSHDIIKDVGNLEYFEGLNLNKELMEDKLLYKYQDEITEEERNIENSEKYENIIKYLKKIT